MSSLRAELQISDDFLLETTFFRPSVEASEKTYLDSKLGRHGPLEAGLAFSHDHGIGPTENGVQWKSEEALVHWLQEQPKLLLSPRFHQNLVNYYNLYLALRDGPGFKLEQSSSGNNRNPGKARVRSMRVTGRGLEEQTRTRRCHLGRHRIQALDHCLQGVIEHVTHVG